MTSRAPAFSDLTPEHVMDAIEHCDVYCDGRIYPLNSYENRVYQVGIEDEPTPWIAKFYRNDRWQDQQIQEEIDFCHELADNDIAVAEPFVFDEGSLLNHHNYRFTVTVKSRGVAPEPDDLDQLYTIGQTLGRIHSVGEQKTFETRPTLSAERLGHQSIERLKNTAVLSQKQHSAFFSAAERTVATAAEILERHPLQMRRLHGDCHLGNILWHENQAIFVDFDDCMNGPAIQDFWMLLAGDRQQQNLQLSTLLEGYEEWLEFDRTELHWLESLRTLRQIHYCAWLTERSDEPAFKQAFSWYGTEDYWLGQIKSLEKQALALKEQPLLSFNI